MYKQIKKIISEYLKEAKQMLIDTDLKIETTAVVQLAIKLAETKFSDALLSDVE